MVVIETLRIAWRGIISNKLRSLLTMLGVIIGVAAVIIMMSVSAGTEASIANQINSLGANLIFVTPNFSSGGMGGGRTITLNLEDAEAIAEEVQGVVGYSVEQTTSQTVKFGNVSIEGASLVGTTPDFPSVREVSVADGRWFNNQEMDRTTKVAVLGSSISQELFGDADPIGEKITVGTTKLTVVGVMDEKGTVGGTDFDGRIYTPVTIVTQKFATSTFSRMAGDIVRTIYVQAESQEIIDDVILQIELLLAKRHEVSLDAPDFAVATQADIIDTMEATTASFRSLLGWVAGVSLLVGGIGIMNIMLVSVTERTREIGIRQSVGATPGDIRGQFLTESLILSLFGGFLGVLAGVGGSYLFGGTSDMPTVILPGAVAVAFTSAAVVGIFFGVVPANKAAGLDPIEALRHD
jgi:putative ABC transport system permease protein